ncbi:MAG: hypothetical protein FWB97_01790 [Oscillospiraceae bacterium]|nr:hypothetical protein [Oscillospiraceae bacterium]
MTRYLLGRKNRPPIFALAILALLFLNACGNHVHDADHGVAQAVHAGIIRGLPQYGEAQLGDRAFQVTQATVRNLARDLSLGPRLIFPIGETVSILQTEGEMTFFVQSGDIVREGDVLGRHDFAVERRNELSYSVAREQLDRFNREFSRERRRRLDEIAQARTRLSAATETERQRLSLSLRQLEVDLELYTMRSETTRDELSAQVAEAASLLGSEELFAPFDGMVANVFYVGGMAGFFGRASIEIDIVDPSVFFFEVIVRDIFFTTNHYNVLGHGDIIPMRAGLFPEDEGEEGEPTIIEFQARVVTESWAAGMRGPFTYWLSPVDEEGLLETLREIDDGHPLNTLRRMRLGAGVQVVDVPDSLTLPIGVVHSEGDARFVYIYNDGRLGKRFIHAVPLGDRYMHIITGLDAGTEVVINP